MDGPDELETLMKELEDQIEESSANSNYDTTKITTDIDNNISMDMPDKTVELIDSFLEETQPMRSEMFADEKFMSSTPKASKTKKSDNDEMWKNIEKYSQLFLPSADETRPVPSSTTETTPAESDVSNKSHCSTILAGNFWDRDEDGLPLDLSLLDDIEGSTLDEILAEEDLNLLDSDEDEDSTVNPLDQTVIEKNTETRVEEAQPVPVPVALPPKKKEVKINSQDLKNIDIKYYKQLEAVFELYSDHKNIQKIPPIERIRTPRIFRHPQKRNIIGYESVQEYIDNNHPVWSDIRQIFHGYLKYQKTDRDIAEYVHNQWDSGLTIDISQNLSCFPRKRHKKPGEKHPKDNSTVVADGQSEETHPGFSSQHDMDDRRRKLVAMYKSSLNSDAVKQKEATRYRWYESRIMQKPEKNGTTADRGQAIGSDKSLMECGICFDVCRCSGKSLAAATGSKRKREDDEEDPAPIGKKQRTIELDELMQVVLETFPNDSQRCANIIKSAEEAMNLNACYVSNKGFSRELAKSLLSLEKVYDEFPKYYRSPYAKDNPVQSKQAPALDTQSKNTEESYSKFLEDY